MTQDYKTIAQHYQDCLEKFGPNDPKGMDWPSLDGMITRYKVMADVIKNEKRPNTVMDIGCGTGIFSQYLSLHRPDISSYVGIDINQNFIDICQKKYPKRNFIRFDIIDDDLKRLLSSYNYAIVNGVFTVKNKLTQEEMWIFFKQLIKKIFDRVTTGLAFNVMSKSVDWERDDLFHVSFDEMSKFIIEELKTRNFVFRNDYNLYEYTTYVYRN